MAGRTGASGIGGSILTAAPALGTSALPDGSIVGGPCRPGTGKTAMEDMLRWVGMSAAVIAAVMVSARLGQRLTGIGFVVFLVSSTSWVAVGLMAGERALTIQNGVLTIVNLVGIWRWLLRPAATGA